MGKGAVYICPVSIATIGLGLEILLSFNYLGKKSQLSDAEQGCSEVVYVIRYNVTTGWQHRSEESNCFLCYSFFSASEK